MAFNESWDEIRDRVREAADIVQVIGEHVQLRRAGANFAGLCPFHGEKTPSFSVNQQRQSYKCFGCGESGDVFAFLMKYQNLTFPEAMQDLARRYQISLPEPKLNEAEQERRRQRDLLQQINAAAAQLWHEFLLKAPQAETARQYLHRRGVPLEFITLYQLGCAPDSWDFLTTRLTKQFPAAAVAQAGLIVAKESGGWYDRFRGRLMFPIVDAGGKVVAFSGRVLGDGQPKYMNSPESLVFSKSRVLFGLYQHRDAIRKNRRAVIVEGNFDLLLLAIHGIGNTVAPLGTALTKEHIHALRHFCNEAVLLFDGDSAGLKAARRAVPIFLAERLDAKVALLPAKHDPDSLIRAEGAAAVTALINDAVPLPEFVFDALVKEHGLTLSGKSKIMAELTELVKQSPDRAQRELMAAHFSSKLGVSSDLLFPESLSPQTEAPSMPPPPLDFAPEQEFTEEFIAQVPAPVQLSVTQRLLLDFLILYPEHFNTLAAGGLLDYVTSCAAPVQEVVVAMQELTKKGQLASERLLSTLSASGTARQHVAQLLLTGGSGDVPDDEEQGRALCAELLGWLQVAKKKQDSAQLLLLLRQAEQTGDKRRVQELQHKDYLVKAEKKHP